MSEFSKALNILHRSDQAENNYQAQQNLTDKVLMSGESGIQRQLLQMYIQRKKLGKIILIRKRDDAFMRTLSSIPNTVIIQNAAGTKTYHPFAGHSENEIYQMLCALPFPGNMGSGLRRLLSYFSKLLVIDENLIEAIVNEGCDLDVLEARVDELCRRNVITENEGRRLLQRMESFTRDFVDLEALLIDLMELTRKGSASFGFRASYSIRSCIEQNKNLVFVFDNNLRAADGYDRMLLSLVSSDIELSLKNTQKEYCFVVDDLKHQYLQPFEWVFSQPNVSCLINLNETADYCTNKSYSQLVKSGFEDYLIFTHKNHDMCVFWSDSFGSARTVEYNYSASNTAVTRYPLLPIANGLFGMQQHSETTGYHFVDKNMHQDYEIRDLRNNELFYFVRSQNRISRHSLTV